jgi:DUF1365 family protein
VKSRLYQGTLRHRRHLPRQHTFKYRVFMPYLRLDELDEVFSLSRLWSRHRFAPARFRREDFLGDPALPLQDEVRRRIREETGATHRGPIYLLANMRYFGLQMNPIACYYCYNEDESRLEYLVAEVTNTPWNERHSYVLRGREGERVLREDFDKAFHVSPFNPMAMRYSWRSNPPGERLAIHLENHSNRGREFDATLALQAEPITARALHRVLWRFPLMTGKVAVAIYWEALKLFIKRVPYYPNPGTATETGAKS